MWVVTLHKHFCCGAPCCGGCLLSLSLQANQKRALLEDPVHSHLGVQTRRGAQLMHNLRDLSYILVRAGSHPPSAGRPSVRQVCRPHNAAQQQTRAYQSLVGWLVDW